MNGFKNVRLWWAYETDIAQTFNQLLTATIHNL